MSDVIYLKTGQFSNRSFNASQKELKKAADALNILDDHGAMSNTTYTCDGISRPIFSVDVINEASSIANLVNSLHEKLEAYSSLLQSGPDALRDADSSFKGEYTNAWQRGWYSISSGVSSVCVSTVGFWGPLFCKGGKKTGDKILIQKESIDVTQEVVSSDSDVPDNNDDLDTISISSNDGAPVISKVIINEDADYEHQWRGDYIIPPKENKQGNRDPEAYREVIEALNVENNVRYEEKYNPYWGFSSTCCNIFVWDVLTAMDCPIPSLDYFGCGAMRDWMGSEAGKAEGWVEIDQATAIDMANQGFPTVAADTRGDHVAMVAPQKEGDQGCYIAEAGWMNFNYKTINWGWGSDYNIDTEIRYFYHK